MPSGLHCTVGPTNSGPEDHWKSGGSGPEGGWNYCSIHGLSEEYNQTLPSGAPCPSGCECCKADGNCGECYGSHICERSDQGFMSCTSCHDKFAGDQSAIDMCLGGAGQGFTTPPFPEVGSLEARGEFFYFLSFYLP